MATRPSIPALPDPGPQLHRAMTAPELLIAALERDPDRVAVVAGDRSLTRRDYADAVSRIEQALAQLGLGPGDPVGVLSTNRIETLTATSAATIRGCRMTALSASASVADLAFIVDDAGLSTIIIDPEAFDDRARELLASTSSLQRVLALGPSETGVDLLAIAERMPPQRLRFAPRDPDEASSVVYTGGTTGRPKGVIGTYRSGAALAHIQLAEWDWPEGTRLLVSTPLSHAGGSFLIPILHRGGALVVLPSFDPAAVLDLVDRREVDAVMVVPTMLAALLDSPRIDEVDLSGLRRIVYGAASASPALIERALQRFGPILLQFYGQTECGMTISILRPGEHLGGGDDRLRSCGRPVPWLTVALLDDDGAEVADGEAGEICVRGPLVTRGYLGRPVETAEALRDGWLHTGDIARRDADGFLTIIDRSKDMIVTGGYNVYSAEVEHAIAADPDVAEVAVIGEPDARWGEAVVACVVVRQGADLDEARLRARVREAKGAIHVPKRIRAMSALPRTPLGKIDKARLRAAATAAQHDPAASEGAPG